MEGTKEKDIPVWPKIILYGDSITQQSFGEIGCWGALLADRVQRKCDVINRGLAGYNSRWNNILLPRILPKENFFGEIAGFVIFLGANDSNDKELNPVQHVPQDEFKENLIAMVQYLQTVGVKKEQILLIGPPPCNVAAWDEALKLRGYPTKNGKNNEVIQSYNKKCSEAAAETSTEYLDLYNLMMANENWTEYLVDGLHLSKSGAVFLFERLCPWVDKRTANIDRILPDWDGVNSTNPSETL